MINQVDVHQAAAALQKGTPLIDVREPDEFAAHHIAGSINIPLSQLQKMADEIPDNCLMICAVGARSGMAASWLLKQGKHATNVLGGIHAWHAAGLPLQ